MISIDDAQDNARLWRPFLGSTGSLRGNKLVGRNYPIMACANGLLPLCQTISLEVAMTRGFAPSVWDRLMGEDARAAPDRAVSRLTLAQLKDTIARDLEALLNTRLVIPKDLLTLYPKCSKSILNYGLVDFAGMCLTSSVDRKAICDCLTAAIERHEPRLSKVSARLVTQSGTINRLNFAISAILNVPEACEAVKFDAELQPSTLRYCIK